MATNTPLSKIQLGSNTYELRDEEAHSRIDNLKRDVVYRSDLTGERGFVQHFSFNSEIELFKDYDAILEAAENGAALITVDLYQDISSISSIDQLVKDMAAMGQETGAHYDLLFKYGDRDAVISLIREVAAEYDGEVMHAMPGDNGDGRYLIQLRPCWLQSGGSDIREIRILMTEFFFI